MFSIAHRRLLLRLAYKTRIHRLEQSRHSSSTALSIGAAGFSTRLKTTVGVVSAIAAPFALSDDLRKEFSIYGEAVTRFSRAAVAGAIISLDYKFSLRDLEKESVEYKAIQSKVHSRSAKRLVELCRTQTGIYTKAAQYVASLKQAIPAEYLVELTQLQDQASRVPLSDVEELFFKEFGTTLKHRFLDFEVEPIASASLAQVHRAVTNDGQVVAVKVQYPRLHDNLEGDLFTIRVLTEVLPWFFPDYRLQWMVPEFRHHLTNELDFIKEAKNGERVAKTFSDNRSLKIPDIRWDLTSKRVLTMEFIDGCKITDLEKLRMIKADPVRVAQVLMDVFSRMIFVEGFVHCDPHPGNLFVRVDPGAPNGFQLVLLDHGLYRELQDDFRRNYCGLWQAIVLRDEPNLKKYSQNLGAGEYYELFSLVLASRPWAMARSLSTNMNSQVTREEYKQMRSKMQQTFNRAEVIDFFRDVPRDLLLVLRTNNFLRSLNNDLGAHVDRFSIGAEYSLRGTYRDNSDTITSASSTLSASSKKAAFLCDLMLLRLRLQIYGLLFVALKTLKRANDVIGHVFGPQVQHSS
mmetsp:Transcript_33258/g.53936  ORF Transcript_33258/g.53936 Transcript_33258/m.53936 type:complete len:575 (+) Transcript_33258:2061-3785(+)|eukprot:CAMPEP_0184654838 /NCGR_PEP_ID=MMETSP0308-20130426/12493_1 /TAXON_ID=38269 /ORGANISM="Gloeochaete witrockiana, Strain SAG 46.84" /LENGTH=574 /DNA_ID=CAMNT_0027091013 /DNA_START=1945 /DNA_END=3669 /DNA_ORIENTATION=-